MFYCWAIWLFMGNSVIPWWIWWVLVKWALHHAMPSSQGILEKKWALSLRRWGPIILETPQSLGITLHKKNNSFGV